MIIANIKDAGRYYALHKSFEKVFAFLKTLNRDSAEGEFAFADFHGHISSLVTSDTDADGTPKKAEAHREYLDIHYVLSGEEAIGYADTDTLCPVTAYFSDADYLLLSGKMQKVFLGAGDFCIVFPEDAHTPAMRAKGDGKLKKAVVKIRLK